MVKINYKIWLFLAFWFLLAMALPRMAQAGSLAITEVMYNPAGSDTGREWLEVRNISTSTLSLSDGSWRFNDGSSHVINAVSSTKNFLEPNDYAIIVDDPNKFKIDYPDFNGLIYDSSFSLKNSDNKIFFTNNGLEDCFVDYQINWGASDDGRSLELNNEKWQTSFLLGGTPGADSSIWPDNLPPTLQISLAEKTEINKEVKMLATVVDPENKLLTVDWQFGDGQFASGVEVSHVYANEGLYTVVAKTVDDMYEVYATSTITITEPTAVKSQTSSVSNWVAIELSELLPNPSGSETENEWIELYNNSPQMVSLDRWQIGDGSSRRFTFKVEKDNTNIDAYGYLVLKRPLSGVSLNNEGEKIVLFTPDGSIKDQVTYDKASEDYAFVRQDQAWQWTTKPTPGKLNEIVEPPESIETEVGDLSDKNTEVTSVLLSASSTKQILDKQVLDQVKFNEIFPNPSGRDDEEWLELKNIGSTTVDMFGYYLDDEDGGSKPYLFSTTTLIFAGEYLVIDKKISKLSLGNIKDSLRLLNQDKKEINRVDYDQVKENYSYSFDIENDDWQWTEVITPGKENQFLLPVQEESNDLVEVKLVNDGEIVQLQKIDQILDLPDKTKVLIEGVIIVQPHLFAKNVFYLADYDEDNNETNLNSKIQVYYSGLKNSDFKIGDLVQIIGTMATSKNERRIKIDKLEQPVKIKTLSNLKIEPVPLAEVNDYDSGSLIMISGQVLDKQASSLFVGNGDELVKVYLKKDTGLLAKDFSKGEWLTIVGVVDSQPGKELRLLPRQKTDIQKKVVAGETETASQTEAVIKQEEIKLDNKESFANKKTIIISIVVFVLMIVVWEVYEYIKKIKK